MKKFFENPMFVIQKFVVEDIITTSMGTDVETEFDPGNGGTPPVNPFGG